MGGQTQEIFYIYVRGNLHERWSVWFEGLEKTNETEEQTVLMVCVPDQAALRGVLDRLWDLNHEVIAVVPENHQPVEVESNPEVDDATPRFATQNI